MESPPVYRNDSRMFNTARGQWSVLSFIIQSFQLMSWKRFHGSGTNAK